MPQKKNPDAAELVRAKAGRVIGALAGLLVTLKGLPMTYAKDLQEDKEPVFDASDSVALGLAAMTGMVAEMQVNEGPMAAAAGAGFSTATDLADWLVQHADIPFREAHEVTGKIVRLAEDQGVTLDRLALEDLQAVAPVLTQEVYAVLDPARALAGRTSAGGTAPERVREAVATARRKLAENTR